jgi:hypothetical protein
MAMGGSYSPSLYYLWTRNWLLVTRKQTPFVLWPFLYAAYIRESMWIYRGLIERDKPQAAEGALSGAWNAILNRYGPIRNVVPPSWVGSLARWHYRSRIGREG